MSLDFNDAGSQKNFDVIPDGTIATVRMTIRPGGAGDGEWLKRSKKGDSEAVDAEFVVLDGEFAKRKFWTLFTVGGTTQGHKEAADISRRKFRAMLDSVHNFKPDDDSHAAKQARRIGSWSDLNGISFVARIGVEPPQNGYKAKNRLDRVITPNEKDWHTVLQTPRPPSKRSPVAANPAASRPAKIKRPSWADLERKKIQAGNRRKARQSRLSSARSGRA
jgi:hypothetical protein